MTFCLYLKGDQHLLPSEAKIEVDAGHGIYIMTIGNSNSATSAPPNAAEKLIMQMYTRLCEEHGEDVPEMVYEVTSG